MVKIRLKRVGTKNRPQWRIVVVDSRFPRDGRFIETLGSYNPLPVDEQIEVKKDRLDYWLKQGAQLSTTLKSLLKRQQKKVAASK